MKAHVRYQMVLIALLGAGLLVSLIEPIYLRDQLLQHIPTVVALVLMAIGARRRVLSDLAMTCWVLFTALHVLGARYVYSFVPYGDWIHAIAGSDVRDALHTTRNHYDRFVHVAFGVLAMPPFVELLAKRWELGARAASAVGLSLVLAIGAVYEIFEWALAVLASPERAESYNGQQGDMWDAQKDMALAALGALPVGCVLGLRARRAAADG